MKPGPSANPHARYFQIAFVAQHFEHQNHLSYHFLSMYNLSGTV